MTTAAERARIRKPFDEFIKGCASACGKDHIWGLKVSEGGKNFWMCDACKVAVWAADDWRPV